MSAEMMSRTPVPADERVAYGSDPNQFFDVFRPLHAAKALVIFIHGGFWRSRRDLLYASHTCSALAQAGFACASLEYRRAGETGGGWPVTFQDIGLGFDAASRRFSEMGSPLLAGHSAGGHLALLLAANTREIRGVLSLAGVACLRLAFDQNLGGGAVRDFMGGTPEELPEYYAAADPVQHKSAVRRVLLHGSKDDIVPLAISRCFAEQRGGDSGAVTLQEIQDADHFDPVDPLSHAWPQVVACLNELSGC